MDFKRLTISLIIAVILAFTLATIEHRHLFRKKEKVLAPPSSQLQPNEKKSYRPPIASAALVQKMHAKVQKRLEPTKRSLRYDNIIKREAEQYGVSPALVKAVIKAESNFNPNAVSPAGAVGLMQVLPQTARRMGVQNPSHPASNIKVGVKYLRELLDEFDNNEALAVAAYNSGPYKVKRYNGVPPYKETMAFVRRVMKYYRSYLTA